MGATAAGPRMTYEEYCAFERAAEVKHEYVRGELLAMAGGSLEHGQLSSRIITLLNIALRYKPCAVYNSDVRVRIEASDVDTYPDASVVCSQPETAKQDAHALLNPLMIVEVLSSSTEAYDRGAKAAHYRRIPSLRAYLMVAQDERRLELQVRLAARGAIHRVASRRNFRRGLGAETKLYRAYCEFRRQRPRRKGQARRRERLRHGLLDDGDWLLLEARPGERLAIAPLDIDLDVDEVYRDPFAAL